MNRKKVHKFLLILLRDLLILILIGNVLSIFTLPKELWTLEMVLRNCMFSVAIGYPAWKGMMWITMVLEKRIPWLKWPIKRMIYQVVALSLFFGLLIFFGFFLWARLTQGLSLRMIMDDALPSLKVAFIFMFLSLLTGNAVLFFKNWKKSAIQQEELKRAHLALQYQSLKDQVRPHFLFNSLSSLATLINTDTKKATQFVHKLSDVYRYVLEQRENELVPLKEDLKFMEDYIFLQKIRFGDNLKIENKLEVNLNRLVIPLSLQMLVENAIKHNEISREHPLVIGITSTGNGHVIVKNNLQRREVSETSLGTGLENLRKQITYFSSDPLLVLEEADAFIVRMP
ncbi:MAG: histidine kinase, partial [Bacteroidetes bacterium]|nr:histidine kinase [Bacteroidota bacterium]